MYSNKLFRFHFKIIKTLLFLHLFLLISRGFLPIIASLWSQRAVRRRHGVVREEEQDIDELSMENVIHFAEFALCIGALIWGHICLLAYKWTSAWSYAWTPWSQQLPNRLKASRYRACQWESKRERARQPRPRPQSYTPLSEFHFSSIALSFSCFLILPGQRFNFQFACWLFSLTWNYKEPFF